MTFASGTRIGPYEVVSMLGAGGMGEVYRATDTKLKRQVAVKIVPPSLAVDPGRLSRFQREAELLASLNHPHIAAVYGLEDADGIKALVMELVEGEDAGRADRTRTHSAGRGAERCRGRSPTRSRRHTTRGSSIAISSQRT